MKPKQKPFLQNLDLVTTILPFGCIALLCCLFMLFPEGSANILASIRFFLGDELGSYYLLMGLGAVLFIWHFPVLALLNWATWKNPSIPLFSGVP